MKSIMKKLAYKYAVEQKLCYETSYIIQSIIGNMDCMSLTATQSYMQIANDCQISKSRVEFLVKKLTKIGQLYITDPNRFGGCTGHRYRVPGFEKFIAEGRAWKRDEVRN